MYGAIETNRYDTIMLVKKREQKAAQCGVFLFLIFVWFIVGAQSIIRTTDEESLLKEELQEFIVPPIAFSGAVYEVKDGEVLSGERYVSLFTRVRILRIAHASILNRLDPLFGMEGTNPEAFKKNLTLLETEKAITVALYDERDQRLLEEIFYPISFLSLLAQTEEKRQTLITTPSQEGASSFYQALDRTLEEYGRYNKVARNIYGRLPNERYVFLGGESSPERFVSALTKLESAVTQRKIELRKRRFCAQDFSVGCPSLHAAFQKLHYEMPPPVLTESIPSTIIEHKAILDTIHATLIPEYHPGHSFVQTGEVIVQTSPGVCEGDALEKPAYYVIQRKEDASTASSDVLFTYLNDIYIFDITNENSPYHQFLKEQGAQYIDKSIENFYLCPDASGRYMELATIAALRDLVRKEPLAKQPLGKKFKTLEARIAYANTLPEAHILAYLAILSDFLIKSGEKDAAEQLGGAWVLHAESLLSMYRTQSGYFNTLIPFVTSRNGVIARTGRFGVRPSISTLLATRTVPLFFLLAHNTSVIPTAPQLLEPTVFNRGRARLLSYENDFKKMYTPEEALGFFIRAKRAIIKADREKYSLSQQKMPQRCPLFTPSFKSNLRKNWI